MLRSSLTPEQLAKRRASDKKHYEENREAIIKRNTEYKKNNPEKNRFWGRQFRLRHLEEERARIRLYGKLNPYKNREKSKRYRTRRRIEIMKILGEPKCIICGESNPILLQFDHINGDGAAQVKKFKGQSTMYNYYWRHPEECIQQLQVMCAPCNIRKACINGEKKGLIMYNYV